MIAKKLRKIIWKVLLMSCMLEKKKYILSTFQNTNQVILLMISNGEGWHNIAALLRRLTFKNNSNFTTWIFFIRLDQQTYLNHIKRYTKIKSFVLPCGDTRILEFNQKQNYDKIPFTIYADLESLIEKMDGRKINSEKLSTTNVGEHVICTL